MDGWMGLCDVLGSFASTNGTARVDSWLAGVPAKEQK